MKYGMKINEPEQYIQGIFVSGHIDSETWCFVLRIKHSDQIFDYKMTRVEIEDSKALGKDIIGDIIDMNIKKFRKYKLNKLQNYNISVTLP